MSIIDKESLQRVADLANIKLDESELEDLSLKIEDILEFLKVIDGVDTSNVSVDSEEIIMNIVREDEVSMNISKENMLSNAMKKDKGHFEVPRVVGS